jgi:hypothetical protein
MFNTLNSLCSSQHASCEMFFIIKPKSAPQLDFRKIALDPSAQNSLTTKFTKKIEEDIINKTSAISSLNPVSSLMNKGNEIYTYDITPPADEFTIIEKISKLIASSNTQPFNFSVDSFSDIKGIVLHLTDGNESIFLYQHTYQVSLHKKSGLSFLKSMNGNLLTEVNHDVIDVRKDFDFFYYKGIHYICNIKVLENYYGLNAIIDNMVKLAIPKIVSLNIIDVSGVADPLTIFDDMKSNRGCMRKLAKIQNNNLPPITMQQISVILTDFPKFGRELTILNNRIELSSQKKKLLFIRLLNDEAVRSALTNDVSLADDRESAT